MSWCRLPLQVLVASLTFVCLGLASAAAGTQTRTVLVARVDGPITPVVADYLTDGVQAAERGGSQVFLVEMDTPGGLDTSMRAIIRAFLGADVPVVVYVAPSGARPRTLGARLIAFLLGSPEPFRAAPVS